MRNILFVAIVVSLFACVPVEETPTPAPAATENWDEKNWDEMKWE